MKEYNGHRSWNAWNISLWIHNEPDWYAEWEWMPSEISLKRATFLLMRALPKRTPDGALFNRLSIKLAIQEYWEK
jgi:hypothetical protein